MRIFILFMLLILIIPMKCMAEEDNSAEGVYKDCVDSWTTGLTKNNPTITAIDVKYVSAYYCLCAIDLAEKDTSSQSSEDKSKKIFSQCMPYAVLRNALHYEVETPTGKLTAGAGTLYGACQFAFPHDVNNKEGTDAIAKFCECASKPLAEVEKQKKDLKEEEIRERVGKIAVDCRNQ